MRPGEEDTLDTLRNLIVGAVVQKVEANPLDEGLFTLFVKREGSLLEVPLYATELGWWVKGAKTHQEDAPPAYVSPEEMLRAMSDFASLDEGAAQKCEPLENVLRLTLGFRITIEQNKKPLSKEFWVHLRRFKGSPWAAPFATREGREWVANQPFFVWDRSDPRDPGRGVFQTQPWVDSSAKD